MANKQLVNGIRVYSRHSADCKHAKDAAHVNCDCAKWLQFQIDGKHVRESAGTRSWAQARKIASQKDRELRGEGPAPEPEATTVEQAGADLIAFRTSKQMGANKARRMGQRLMAWAKENNITCIHQITTSGIISFRDSLP